MAEPAIRHMTLAEFLRWEDRTDTRYELLWGVPVATAPPARAHRMLCPRLGGVVDAALRTSRPCSAQTEAGTVRPDRDDTYYVADLAVTSSPYQRGEQLVKDRILIDEIPSAGTKGTIAGPNFPFTAISKASTKSCLSTRKAFTPKYCDARTTAGLPSWFGVATRSCGSLRPACRSRWRSFTKESTSMPRTRPETLQSPPSRTHPAT
jgi:Putative restriction endonuclease